MKENKNDLKSIKVKHKIFGDSKKATIDVSLNTRFSDSLRSPIEIPSMPRRKAIELLNNVLGTTN